MTVDGFATWLRAQLDEDEREADRVEPNQAPRDLRAMVTREGSPPFLVIDSARVLAEVDAKRRILDEHSPHRHGTCPVCWRITGQSSMREMYPCPTLRLLALPYADRPGYRDEWRP